MQETKTTKRLICTKLPGLRAFISMVFAITLTGCDSFQQFALPYLNDNPHDARQQSESDKPNKIADNYLTADNSVLCVPYSAHSRPVDPVLPMVPPSDLWQRSRNGFALDLSQDNRRIEAQLNWYKRHPAYFERVSERASRYMYHIVEELEQQNMPLEIALLPIVESAYDPFAYSHGQAAGMWQFIPGTGRRFGLDLNWWYDGRRDVLASTDAALAYLNYLNKHFDGDWLLALAAYNSGEGKVNRAIRKNAKKGLDTDFWALDLPRETREYVPKLIALAKLVSEPENYGLELPAIKNEPYFAKVDIGSQIDLAQAASLADVGMDELYRLNPGFNQWATAPTGPHYLLVPSKKENSFKQALLELPAKKRLGWQRHDIKSGDSLIKIANQYNTQVDLVRRINGIKGNSIRAGKTLMVPVALAPMDDYVLSLEQRLEKIQTRSASRKNSHKVNYTVRKGDSFWKISQRYKVGIKELAKWNGMAPGDPLRPGKTLSIWVPRLNKDQLAGISTMSREPMIRKVGYKVRSGDSLARIAGKFNVSVRDIVRWNTLDSSDYLQPGQALTLYVDVMNVY